MSRKFVALVLGATFMLGVVGVGAAPAGAQPPPTMDPTVSLPSSISPPSSLDALIAQIEVVCSDASYLPGTGADRLNTACAQLPTLKLLVDQINELCSSIWTPTTFKVCLFLWQG